MDASEFSAVALCQPAMRMVVVLAYDGGSNDTHKRPQIFVCPVVAIQFDAKNGVQPVIVDPFFEWANEGGLVVPHDFNAVAHVEHKAVVCHWPAAEDDTKLVPHIDSVVERLNKRTGE